MSKTYQTTSLEDTAGRRVLVPEQVTVALTELTGQVQEGLLSLAVATGLQVMAQLMDADVEAVAGPKGKPNPNRAAVRHGTGVGSVTLGGRRVPVVRPRVRSADGCGELPVAAYDPFSSTELLGRLAMEKMLAGLSTRRYRLGPEPVGSKVESSARSTSRSAVSRRFVAGTETALGELLAQDLSGLELVALMVDGVHFAGHLCVVALWHRHRGREASAGAGRGLDREHHVGPRPAGRAARAWPGHHPADPGRPGRRQSAGRRGAGGVRPAGNRPLPDPQDQDNVTDRLPEKMRPTVESRMPAAYSAGSELEAKAQLEALVRELDKTRPGAAASLREGLEETLTVLRLGVPPTLARTLRSTNAIESMIGICRNHARNVKRWRDGQMALRWCAAGMVQARSQFRRVNWHPHLHLLAAELERVTAEIVAPERHNEDVKAA